MGPSGPHAEQVPRVLLLSSGLTVPRHVQAGWQGQGSAPGHRKTHSDVQREELLTENHQHLCNKTAAAVGGRWVEMDLVGLEVGGVSDFPFRRESVDWLGVMACA